MTSVSRKFITALMMIIGILAVPPLVFLLVALVKDMSVSESVAALIEQYSSSKQNLLVVGLVACLPLLLLGIVLWLHGRAGGLPAMRRILTWSGYLPIWLVAVWVNTEYWSDYLPARTFLGFPHGLEFVIGPLFFAPAGLAMCMLVAWLATRRADPK
jgi:hypothetical protein